MNDTTNTTAALLPEWVSHEQIVYSGIIALIGIPGNILIILVFAWSQERDKTTTDYMVFSMATSDLLGSLFCTTFNILQNIHVIWARIGSTWFCRLSEYFAMLTTACSVWLLSITAFDRYMKTCRPHSVFFTVSRARLICASVCTLVATLSGLAAVVVHFDRSSGTCLVNEDMNIWTIADTTIVAGCFLSVLVTAVAYIFVAFALCKRLKEKIRRRRATWRSRDIAKEIDSGEKGECRKKHCGQKPGNQLELSETKSAPIDVNQVYVVEDTRKVLGSNVNGKSKSECQAYKKAGMDDVLRLEQKRVNRTTVVMFLITAINSSTFILMMMGNFLTEESVTDLSLTFGYLTQTSYMANYITNPLLYMIMSSKFRDNVRKLFKRR